MERVSPLHPNSLSRLVGYVFLLIALLLSGLLNAQSNVNRKSTASLRHQIEQIAQAAQGRVGVAAAVVETGASVEWHGDEPFPMQSVYKLPIGMAVLHLIDEEKLTLPQPVRVEQVDYVSPKQHSPIRDKYPDGTQLRVSELLRYAVSESDGSASDVLMRLVGGPPIIMDYLKSIGVNNIRIANTEKEIGGDNAVQYRNWAKPEAIIALLCAIQKGRGLSKSGRARLMRLMTETQTGLRRLKGRLPAATEVAHKTGSSGTINGITAATNDVGLITLPNGHHIAIAVFVSDAKAEDTTRETVIAKIARAVWDFWN